MVKPRNRAIGLPPGRPIPIKVSAKMARLKFIECGPKCIATGCVGKCCDAPTHPDGCRVSVSENEGQHLAAAGAKIVDGFIKPKPGHKGCPFKTEGHLCSLHGTPLKPFGCIVSPYALNKNNTLIIRNRYKLLPCYDPINGAMSYSVFRTSLLTVFGTQQTNSLTKHLDAGGGDLILGVDDATYDKLSDRETSLQNQELPNNTKKRKRHKSKRTKGFTFL